MISKHSLWFFLLIFISTVFSCGVTTHTLIGHEAFSIFRGFDDNEENAKYIKIIGENQDAFQSGAAFPDFGYACPLNDVGYTFLADASEAAHWSPFQNATVQYIRKLKTPWDQATQKLVAFLLGIVSHSTADILWHDIAAASPTQQGLIQALADANYNARGSGYSSDVHEEADTGGEFVAAAEFDLQYLLDSWYVPIEDLTQIFHSVGFTGMETWILDFCVSILYLEVMAIKNLPSEVIFPHFADRAPFLVDEYQDWFIGGINNMAGSTTVCWNSIFDWIKNGPNLETLCYVEKPLSSFPNTKESIYFSPYYKAAIARHEYLQPIVNDAGYKVAVTPSLRGISISLDNPVPPKKEALPLKNLDASDCKSTTSLSPISFYMSEPFSEFGHGIISDDFNNDGIPEMVISAPLTSWHNKLPHHGSVFIFSVNQTQHISPNSQILIEEWLVKNDGTLQALHGSKPFGRFGWSMTSLDFNLDGYQDLAVSAPSEGGTNLEFYGHVYIFFGSSKGLSNSPNVEISSSELFTSLGYTLKAIDLRGNGQMDLGVGCPFAKAYYEPYDFEAGQLKIFQSSKQWTTGTVLSEKQAYLTLSGTEIFEWYGYDFSVILEKGKRILVVGSPFYNNGTVGSTGKVTGYEVTNLKNQTQLKVLWTLLSSSENSQFGHSSIFGKVENKNVLAVSMPTQLNQGIIQSGIIDLLNLDQLEGNIFIEDFQNKSLIESIYPFSRLGWVMGIENDFLWSGEPFKNTDAGLNTGSLTFWALPSTKPLLCIDSQQAHGRFGASVKVMKNGNDYDLWVGAPKDPQVGLNGGKVYFFSHILLI